MTVSEKTRDSKMEERVSTDFLEEEYRSLLSPEDDRILKERAKRLAICQPIEDEDAQYVEFTEFTVSSERYGIENLFVKEVFSLKRFTCLPGVPAYVLGIVNLRGRILSVLDTRILFELPGERRENTGKIIVLRDDMMEFGVLADSIIGVRRYPVKDLESTLPTLASIPADFLKGITKDRMTLLDGGKLLKDPRIIVHQEL